MDCATADSAGRIEVRDENCAEDGENEGDYGDHVQNLPVGSMAKLLGTKGWVSAAPFKETVVDGTAPEVLWKPWQFKIGPLDFVVKGFGFDLDSQLDIF